MLVTFALRVCARQPAGEHIGELIVVCGLVVGRQTCLVAVSLLCSKYLGLRSYCWGNSCWASVTMRFFSVMGVSGDFVSTFDDSVLFRSCVGPVVLSIFFLRLWIVCGPNVVFRVFFFSFRFVGLASVVLVIFLTQFFSQVKCVASKTGSACFCQDRFWF
jgi:hypothetical protein